MIQPLIHSLFCLIKLWNHQPGSSVFLDVTRVYAPSLSLCQGTCPLPPVSSAQLATLPPHVNDQLASLIGSGQKLLATVQSIMPGVNRELDNINVIAQSLLELVWHLWIHFTFQFL